MVEERIETIIRRLDITLLLAAGMLMLLIFLIVLTIALAKKNAQKRKKSLNILNGMGHNASDITSITHDKESFLNRFLKTVETSMDSSELTIERIARNLGTSRAQLFRKVKAESGRTPNELIHEIRLEKASILLKSTSMSVSEVAYAVGFSSPSYFSKCYKKKYGAVPSRSKA